MTAPVLTAEESQRRADLVAYATRLAVAWRQPSNVALQTIEDEYRHLPWRKATDGLPTRFQIAMAVDRGWRFSKGMA